MGNGIQINVHTCFCSCLFASVHRVRFKGWIDSLIGWLVAWFRENFDGQEAEVAAWNWKPNCALEVMVVTKSKTKVSFDADYMSTKKHPWLQSSCYIKNANTVSVTSIFLIVLHSKCSA